MYKKKTFFFCTLPPSWRLSRPQFGLCSCPATSGLKASYQLSDRISASEAECDSFPDHRGHLADLSLELRERVCLSVSKHSKLWKHSTTHRDVARFYKFFSASLVKRRSQMRQKKITWKERDSMQEKEIFVYKTTSRLVPSPWATPTRFLFGRQKEDALYGFSMAGIQILVFSMIFSSVFRYQNQHWALIWLEIFNFESSSPLNPQSEIVFGSSLSCDGCHTLRKLSALL